MSGSRTRQASRRVDVLYICGARRSGAVMLEAMLSQGVGVLGLGDVQAFWRVAFASDGATCSCGLSLADCPLWGHVRAHLPQSALDAARLRHAMQHKLHHPSSRWAWWKGSGSDNTGAYEELLRATAMLYSLACDASHDSILVDASGSARYGAMLCDAPDLRVHVVHLVRDPRAVAYSYRRRASLPAAPEKKAEAPHSSRSSASAWVQQNRACAALSRTAATYVRVRYEALTQEPYGTVERILETAGLDVPASGELKHGSVYFDGMHAVAGSTLRFMRGGMPIRADKSWRSGLTSWDKVLVTALTSPMLLRYGYSLLALRATN